jgi:hypothetical protein
MIARTFGSDSVRVMNRRTLIVRVRGVFDKRAYECFNSVPEIRALAFDRGPMHPDEWDLLAQLAQIEILEVGNRVSDVDLDQLARIPYVQHLDLGRANVSDAGLRRLEKISTLQGVSVSYSPQLSAEAVDALRRARPDVHIGVNPQWGYFPSPCTRWSAPPSLTWLTETSVVPAPMSNIMYMPGPMRASSDSETIGATVSGSTANRLSALSGTSRSNKR